MYDSPYKGGDPRNWFVRYLPMPQRVFAGQADQSDASRFSIEFEWPGGNHGFVDAKLNDDDSVDFTIRPGPGDIKSERRAVFGGP